jgi:hypothetical protein
MLSQLYNSAEDGIPSVKMSGIIKANLAPCGNSTARFKSPHHLIPKKPSPKNSGRLP